MKTAVCDMVVVGAGPAGLMAAIAAGRAGRRVTVLEHMGEAGRKLLATGNGRCNLTNTEPDERFMAAFGRQGRFIQPALAQMDADRLRSFLRALGVPTHAPDCCRVYPVSERATDVRAALVAECGRVGVKLITGRRVTGLCVDGGAVAGVAAREDMQAAACVVIATGGLSYPRLGATGDGYEMARKAGHTIVPALPVLVSLRTRESWPGECAGVSIPDSQVWIDAPGMRGATSRGDILFTHTGISGPAVLDLSRSVSPTLRDSQEVPVRLCLAPGTAVEAWPTLFEDWQNRHGRRRVVNLLDELMPASLARIAARLAGIAAETTAASLDRAARSALVELMAGVRLTVVGTGGFEEAIVTRGGVALKEIDPRTLQSRLVRGLYFAGEVMDLDGPEGGYNLQWAFSSGWLAGSSVVGQTSDIRSQESDV